MKKLLMFAVCIASLLLIGCGASDPMVGTWKLQPSDKVKDLPAGMKPEATAEFKTDKTYTVSISMGERKDTMSGTYALDGKTVTMSATMESGKPSTEKNTVTLSDDMKSFDVPGAAEMGKMVKQ